MGSGEHTLSLVEVLSHSHEARDEQSPDRGKSLEDLEKTLEAKQGGEMPLEELLSLYGYEVSEPVLEHDREPNELTATLPDMTLDKDQIAKDLLSGEEEEETQSSADDLTPSVTSHASDIFRRHLRAQSLGDKDKESSSEADSDGASIHSGDGRKDIMVGPQFQATIPPLNTRLYQERAYENEDQLLWAPGMLPVAAVEDFLLQAQRQGGQEGATETPTSGDIIKDNEQALYELVKCNFNAEEALRRLHFNVKVFSEELCAWSEEECRNFEHGYRVHGKNFHLIQANKVRTRSVGECVEYYYMWKKSERHEYFTQQTTKLGRKKYSLQSGIMEDGEQDGDGAEVEGSSHPLSSPPGALATSQPGPPSPAAVLDLEKQDAELGGGISDLCGNPCPSPPREPLLNQLSLLSTKEDPPQPVKHCPGPTGRLAPPSGPLAQCHAPQGPYDSALPQPSGPQLLGPGFYQLQLGPFVTDGMSTESGATKRLQVGFSLPSPPPPSPAVASTVSVTSEFGVISSFLCPRAMHTPPVRHPRSLKQ
ncbi:mesoderm induction early response protein 2 isoform X1 [Paramormyrops kingsleyae]|nr:mesoderm induction early response protein 2 isoform X1 [Paramormyrops kingsleyae]XP_023699622.1 mesoderm induction early response protein 2 isoform X1 [Paramormyrops kingsleyae]XP_023699623.1 mesoderm induction early response protein 2 isoform X1 [Paramormyrops kingsleyae]